MGSKRKLPDRGTDAYYEAKGLVKLTVRIPAKTRDALKQLAEDWGVSGVAEVIVRLLERNGGKR